ncbi:MAG: helix-turn-helix transcriptional regulator [Lachnospiraceae bacterium]
MAQKIKADITLGNNLRRIRRGRKLTQEQVTAKLQLMGFDITRSIYSQIECGTYNIKVTELLALKEIYDTDFDDIFLGISLH